MVIRRIFLHLENHIVRLRVQTQHRSDTALRRHNDGIAIWAIYAGCSRIWNPGCQDGACGQWYFLTASYRLRGALARTVRRRAGAMTRSTAACKSPQPGNEKYMAQDNFIQHRGGKIPNRCCEKEKGKEKPWINLVILENIWWRFRFHKRKITAW